MISFAEALSRLLTSPTRLGAERVPLARTAGRVLAEDVRASEPLPPFDQSAMDGYALATCDLGDAGPWELPVVGESAAGGVVPELTARTACRIFTGARMPPGADAVVMQEHVTRQDSKIFFRERPRVGNHVRRQGDDLADGAIALTCGTRLTPGRIALAAALDRPELLVTRSPLVTVLCSGDELRAPGCPRVPGSIPESNGYFVEATARAAGAIVRHAPYVGDHPEASRHAVADALRGSDLLVTVGGVSVGDRDVIRPALEAAGVSIDFWKVNIKPGKPLAVGRTGATHVLSLPGNPASASLTFLLFGVPLLRAMQGDALPLPPRLRAVLRSSIRREPGREQFVRVQLDIEGSELGVRPLGNQASGAATSFAEADALAVIPAEQGSMEAGQVVEIIRLSDV